MFVFLASYISFCCELEPIKSRCLAIRWVAAKPDLHRCVINRAVNELMKLSRCNYI